MLSKVSRILVTLVLLCTVTLSSANWANPAYGNEEDNDSGRDNKLIDSARDNGYDSYLQRYENANRPEQKIVIKGSSYSHAEGMLPKVLSEVGDEQGSYVLTEDAGEMGWDVTIPEDGLYNITLRYFTVEGKVSSIERQLLIDGEVPFSGAGSLLFPRIWKNEKEQIEKDNRGNDVRPRQVEASRWQEMPLKDSDGYYEEPYSFYFSAGNHKISLVSLREPVIIDTIEISQIDQLPTYEELLRNYREKGI
jgi:hypothetical protein